MITINELDSINSSVHSQPYNIFSLPKIDSQLRTLGYNKIIWKEFTITSELEKPVHKKMGTYTVMTKKGNLMQISGPLLMPWWFCYAAKE